MNQPATDAPVLSEEHRRMLTVESGLSEDTIAARGYRTVSGPEGASELTGLGFNLAQGRTAQHGDVLLVPLCDVSGQAVSYQIRPDAPRVTRAGSILKYETAAGRGNRVDVPPAGRGRVADGTSPIWITEGAKTADALAQAGAGVLMLAGVWGFMGRAALGAGTSVLMDLLNVPIEGRTVYLAYDSDVVTKEPVQAAERRLAEVLSTRGAQVLVVRIPSAEGGAKQGADDYLAAGGTLDELVATAESPIAADPLAGKSPQVYAYDLATEGQELALDTTGSFLLRPVDTDGRAAGPAQRYSRDELRDRVMSLAGARGAASKVLVTSVTNAVSRLAGDHVDTRVSLAPAHLVRDGQATWVDMGTSGGSDVVRIGPEGWGYAPWADVPQWVVRGEQAPILGPPAPPEQRSWTPLRELLALDEETFAVIRTWLVSVLVADRVPLLWWRGEPGSGKSTRAELVGRALGLPKLTTAPRDRQDAMSKLQAGPWLMAENLGKLDPAISDMWCAAITDGVLSERILYSARQWRIEGRWTGQVTSITDVPGALDDLMSRSLMLDIPATEQRSARTALLAAMDQHAPTVRGALFDDAAAVLATLADWDGRESSTYRFPAIAAIARALDGLHGGGHLDALEDSGTTAVAERGAEDPWVQWLAEETRSAGGRWEATAGEILDAQRAARKLIDLNAARDEELWPGSARAIGSWLPAKAGRLRAAGVDWRKGHRGRGSDKTRAHILTTRTNSDTGGDVGDVVKITETNVVPTKTAGQTGGGDVGDVGDDVLKSPTGERANDVDENACAQKSRSALGKQPSPTSPTSPQACDQEFSGDDVGDADSEDVPNVPAWRVSRGADPEPIDPAMIGRELAALIASEGTLTVDVETSGYPVGHQDYRLRTVQLGGAETAFVFDVREPDPDTYGVIRLALGAAPRLHAHSATADLVPLAAAGLCDESAWDRMWDTVIPAKLADPQSTGADPGLKQLASTVLSEHATAPGADAARAALFKRHKWRTNLDVTTPVERSGWAQVDPADPVMLTYAASDVLDTAALVDKLPTLPAELIEREREVQRITARVTHRGLVIDYEHVNRLAGEHTDARQAAAERVRAAGVDNPGSDRQIAEALSARGVKLPHTRPSTRHPEGQPSVAAGVLEGLRGIPREAAELVVAVLDYRGHDTVLGTFLEPYRQLCERGDGRARPTVYTLGTDTGRMSCVRPNLQQLPREGGVRACITADEGYALVSADFSGVELRVAAALSGDPSLARMITEGDDLHWKIAREVWGSDATKANRYAAKRIVFGRLYGGGVPTLARQAGVDDSIAASAVDVLDMLTPGLSAWSRSIREAVKLGQTQFPTYSGRIIHLPPEYPHKAPNYCIQGTARELLVDALLAWDRVRPGCVVMPVHDEVVTVVPEAEAAEATTALVECMATELYGVPIAAEASEPARFWQDAA